MQKYMPHSHRTVLERLRQSKCTVRQLALKTSTSPSIAGAELVTNYNAALLSLRKFRDAHLKVACIFIVAHARMAKVAQDDPYTKFFANRCPMSSMMNHLDTHGADE